MVDLAAKERLSPYLMGWFCSFPSAKKYIMMLLFASSGSLARKQTDQLFDDYQNVTFLYINNM